MGGGLKQVTFPCDPTTPSLSSRQPAAQFALPSGQPPVMQSGNVTNSRFKPELSIGSPAPAASQADSEPEVFVAEHNEKEAWLASLPAAEVTHSAAVHETMRILMSKLMSLPLDLQARIAEVRWYYPRLLPCHCMCETQPDTTAP